MPRRKITDARLSAAACTAVSALVGFAVVLAIVLMIAFLMTKIDVPDNILSVMTTAALCVGAYAGGLVSARKRHRNGLLMGVICAVFMFFIVFVLSTIFAQKASGFSGSSKLILTLVCGAVGGVVGVNSRHGRF